MTIGSINPLSTPWKLLDGMGSWCCLRCWLAASDFPWGTCQLQAISFCLLRLSSICKAECISCLQKGVQFKTETSLDIPIWSWCHLLDLLFKKIYFQGIWSRSSAQILSTKVREPGYCGDLSVISLATRSCTFCTLFSPWTYIQVTAVQNVH